MNKQMRLYKQGYRPVYKVVPNVVLASTSVEVAATSGYNKWQHIPTPPSPKQYSDENLMQLRFKFKFDSHFLSSYSIPEGDKSCGFTVFFAFCFPQSYIETQTKIRGKVQQIREDRASNNYLFTKRGV